MNYFDSWDINSAKVAADDILDLSTDLSLMINNKVEIRTHPGTISELLPGEDSYGHLDGVAVYLPEKVCKFIQTVSLSNALSYIPETN